MRKLNDEFMEETRQRSRSDGWMEFVAFVVVLAASLLIPIAFLHHRLDEPVPTSTTTPALQ